MREKEIPSCKRQEILLDIEERKFMRGNRAEQKYISILKKMDGNKRVKIGAEGILQVQGNSIDNNYLIKWAEKVSVRRILKKLLKTA